MIMKGASKKIVGEDAKMEIGLKEALAECVIALSHQANGYQSDVDSATIWDDQDLLDFAAPRLASVRAALAVMERWAAMDVKPFTTGRYHRAGLRALRRARGGERMRFCLDRDNDGHWYIIPADKVKAWAVFLSIPEDDERSWDVPDWAQRINGSPSRITFENPEEE
jgi:hypothetical protein